MGRLFIKAQKLSDGKLNAAAGFTAILQFQAVCRNHHGVAKAGIEDVILRGIQFKYTATWFHFGKQCFIGFRMLKSRFGPVGKRTQYASVFPGICLIGKRALGHGRKQLLQIGPVFGIQIHIVRKVTYIEATNHSGFWLVGERETVGAQFFPAVVRHPRQVVDDAQGFQVAVQSSRTG